jgi:5-phospho-D-xylono-1,4-lactonase
MPSVRTILGDVDADSLGIIYFHEHTISQPPRHYAHWEQDLVLDDVAAASRELAEFMSVGGTCVVDGTTIDYGRDAAASAEVARRSGCHVVATAGYNKAAYFTPDIESASLDELAEVIARDANIGMDGTTCRAGILKFGTSYRHMTPAEERAARAVCRVQRATGLPLYTHTEAGTFALEQLELMEGEGVDTARVCVGHLDRNPDLWYLRQIARRGVFIGIDQIAKLKYATDDERIDLIIALIEAGCRRRILISGDMARRSYLTAYGGGPGLQYLAGIFVPRLLHELRRRGLTASDADRVGEELLIQNPRDFLSIQS